MNLLPFRTEKLTEVETNYEFYLMKPNNLTFSECQLLLKKISDKFLHCIFNEEYWRSFNESSQELLAENNQIWIKDFFIYINTILIFSFIACWIFLFPNDPDKTGNQNENTDVCTTKCIEDKTKSLEDDVIKRDENADEFFEETLIPEQYLSPEDIVDYLEVLSLPMFDESTDQLNSIDETELAFDLNFNNGSESGVAAITSIYENLASSTFSTPLKVEKKQSKNFLAINIEKVKQKSQTARLCRSEESVEKTHQKSSIPVRVAKPLDKKQDEEGEKTTSYC